MRIFRYIIFCFSTNLYIMNFYKLIVHLKDENALLNCTKWIQKTKDFSQDLGFFLILFKNYLVILLIFFLKIISKTSKIQIKFFNVLNANFGPKSSKYNFFHLKNDPWITTDQWSWSEIPFLWKIVFFGYHSFVCNNLWPFLSVFWWRARSRCCRSCSGQKGLKTRKIF